MKLNIKPLSISTEQYYKNKLLNYKGDCGFDLFFPTIGELIP